MGRGRIKLRNEEFDGFYVGNDHEAMESEMDGSLNYVGVKRKMRNRGTAPLILNLGTKRNSVVNFTSRSLYTRERSPVPTELEAGLVPDSVCTMKVTIHVENGYRELTGQKSCEN